MRVGVIPRGACAGQASDGPVAGALSGRYLGQILSYTLGALASNSRRVLYWPGPGIGSSATVTLRCWGGLKALVLVSPSRLGAVLKAPPAAS